jgi:YegS/Rv2252/BmrU family lipid kinase
MENTWFLIANPRSGKGKLQKEKAKVQSWLKAAGIAYEWHFTEYQEHAALLAKQAADNGFTHFISAGGDGTLHEVVNGLMLSNPQKEFTVGLIPIGTGNDWAKSFDYPVHTEKAVQKIKEGKTLLHDIGKVTLQTDQGEATKYFINIAGLCYDAYVTRATNIGKARGEGGKFYYLKTILANLFSYTNTLVTYSVDGKEFSGSMFNLCVGINRFNGDGVQQCPYAKPDDGLFDITAYTDFTKLQVISNLPHLKTGAFVKHPKMRIHTGKVVRVSSVPEVLVEADGEDLGRTPAEFSILPRAIRMVV